MENKLVPLPSGKIVDCTRIALLDPKPESKILELRLQGADSTVIVLQEEDWAEFLIQMERTRTDVTQLRKKLGVEPPPQGGGSLPTSPVDKIQFYDVT